jgi:hypothetical protein
MADEIGTDDVVELGSGRRHRLPGWRPSRGADVLAVAALVAGLAIGYAAGDQHTGGTAALPAPTATASPSSASAPDAMFSFANSPALTQDIGACSVQTGRQLQLGVQVTNQSAEPLTLLTAKAVLPLGGLNQVTWQWATCGAIPDGLGQAVIVLMPGQSTWLTATFTVQLHCPGPLPVQFSVGYLVQSHSVTASLPGFPDLSQVPYSGCPPVTASLRSVQIVTANH